MPSHTFTREVPSIPGVYWTDRSYAAQLCGVDHECSGQWIHPRGGYLNNLEGIGWFYGPLPTEMCDTPDTAALVALSPEQAADKILQAAGSSLRMYDKVTKQRIIDAAAELTRKAHP
jgi:hypothetical protein